MSTQQYLERIGHRGPTHPSAETLRELHRAHLMTVPFENLDIHRGREIVLDEDRLVAKIVRERRGGFCYELNGAFAALLRALGFEVTLLSARVAHSPGVFGPDFDHLLLRVELEEPWIADVGFGDCFLDPHPLRAGIREEGSRAYRLDELDDLEGGRLLLQREAGGEWSPQYRFTLERRELADFSEMCRYHQTSPESHFTQKRVVTRATPAGRITLRDDRLIFTEGTERREEPLAGEDEYTAALKEWFGIERA